MPVTTKRELITADELLLMPRDVNRYELIRGVLVGNMPRGDIHGVVIARIAYVLGQYVEGNDCGGVRLRCGYWLDRDPDTVRAPDISWIAPGRVPVGLRGYPEFAPDLAVEVKSPNNSNPEMAAKAAMWLSYGSQEVWVADPESTSITVHRPGGIPETLGEDETLDGGDLLPGFTTPVWRLFRRRR